MTSWNYLIATYADAPERASEGGKASSHVLDLDLDRPRVSVFCAEPSHVLEPWLVDSFEPNYRWLEQTGKLVWRPVGYYPTGDGYGIRLGKRDWTQWLAGEAVLGPDEDTPPQVRARYPFRCGLCSQRATWRSESIQLAMTFLASAGHREVSLSGLKRVVSGLARATGC